MAAGKAKIDSIRNRSEAARPELESAIQNFDDALDAVLDFADILAGVAVWLPTVKRFVSRILGREFIIAIVSIIAIWSGDLGHQEAIAIGAAASCLAQDRGLAKNHSGNNRRSGTAVKQPARW